MKNELQEERDDADPTQPVAFRCTDCGLTVLTEEELRAHDAVCILSNRPKNYTCPDCGKGFFKGSQLRIHLRTHTGERPYNCLYCQMSFKKNHHAKRHMRQVHKMEPPRILRSVRERKEYGVPAPLDPFNQLDFQSKIYEDSFPPMPTDPMMTEEIDLQDTADSTETKKICPVCGLDLVGKHGRSADEEVRIHMRLVHQFDWNFVPYDKSDHAVGEESYLDPVSSVLAVPPSLYVPPLISNSSDQDKFTCSHCDREFTNIESLNKHQMKCTSQTPEPPAPVSAHTCFECRKAFPNAHLLSLHTAEHVLVRKPKAAESKKNSSLHKEMNYPGAFRGGVTAAQINKLSQWIPGTCGEVPMIGTPYIPPPEKFFSCPKCGREFNRKDNCATHMKKCIGEPLPNQPPPGQQVYTCEECGREFRGQFHMYGHKGMHARDRKDQEQLRTLSR